MNNLPQTNTHFPFFRRVFFNRRMLKRLAFVLASVATLLGCFYAVENWRGAQAQESLQSQWRAQGKHPDRALIPPPIPDAENFAMTPFFAPLFDFAPGTQVVRDTNAAGRVHDLAKDFRSVSTKGGWRVGAKTDFADAYHALQKARQKEPETGVDIRAAAAGLLEAIKEYDPIFNELRAAAATRSQSRFNIRYEQENPCGILLPHLAPIKKCCHILWGRASSELVLGQTDQAFADIMLILFLADSVKNEPVLISQLVRVAGFNIAMQVIWEGMAARQWSDAQLQTLQARLAEYDFMADLKRSLEGERSLANLTIERVRDHRISLTELGYGLEEGNAHPELAVALKVGPRGWFDLEQFNYNRIFDQRLLTGFDQAMRLIYAKTSDENTRLLDSELSRSELLRSVVADHLVFARLLLPAISKTLQKFGLAQTSADQAMVACALERYRQNHGQYPASAVLAAPVFISKVPHDLFSGEPLRYRRTNDGQFVLYSLGWNEKDDEGAVFRIKTSGKGVQDLTQGDWVWHSSATAEP